MKYYKLFDLLNSNMKKTDLLNVISAPTLAKLGKGESITTDILCKICNFLNCQPGDIMEYIPEQVFAASTPTHTIPLKSGKKQSLPSDTPKPSSCSPVTIVTPEPESQIDLKRLLSDFLYQIDISAAYGNEVLASLLDKARKQQRETTEKEENMPVE